jgi:hypothetical protein
VQQADATGVTGSVQQPRTSADGTPAAGGASDSLRGFEQHGSGDLQQPRHSDMQGATSATVSEKEAQILNLASAAQPLASDAELLASMTAKLASAPHTSVSLLKPGHDHGDHSQRQTHADQHGPDQGSGARGGSSSSGAPPPVAAVARGAAHLAGKGARGIAWLGNTLKGKITGSSHHKHQEEHDKDSPTSDRHGQDPMQPPAALAANIRVTADRDGSDGIGTPHEKVELQAAQFQGSGQRDALGSVTAPGSPERVAVTLEVDAPAVEAGVERLLEEAPPESIDSTPTTTAASGRASSTTVPSTTRPSDSSASTAAAAPSASTGQPHPAATPDAPHMAASPFAAPGVNPPPGLQPAYEVQSAAEAAQSRDPQVQSSTSQQESAQTASSTGKPRAAGRGGNLQIDVGGSGSATSPLPGAGQSSGQYNASPRSPAAGTGAVQPTASPRSASSLPRSASSLTSPRDLLSHLLAARPGSPSPPNVPGPGTGAGDTTGQQRAQTATGPVPLPVGARRTSLHVKPAPSPPPKKPSHDDASLKAVTKEATQDEKEGERRGSEMLSTLSQKSPSLTRAVSGPVSGSYRPASNSQTGAAATPATGSPGSSQPANQQPSGPVPLPPGAGAGLHSVTSGRHSLPGGHSSQQGGSQALRRMDTTPAASSGHTVASSDQGQPGSRDVQRSVTMDPHVHGQGEAITHAWDPIPPLDEAVHTEIYGGEW